DGLGTMIEKGIGPLVKTGVDAGRLRATCDIGDAVRSSTLSLVCVGTPSRNNGSLDTTQVERVCAAIGAALRGKTGERHTVVIRSTVLPGTIHGLVVPALEQASGMRAGRDFDVCVNPEFLRAGCA